MKHINSCSTECFTCFHVSLTALLLEGNITWIALMYVLSLTSEYLSQKLTQNIARKFSEALKAFEG